MPVEQDTYGKGLLAAGISAETLREWSADPAVSYGGNRQSVFDLLEDLDADACLDKAREVAAGN